MQFIKKKTEVEIMSSCWKFPPCKEKRQVTKTNKTSKTCRCLRCFKQSLNNLS